MVKIYLVTTVEELFSPSVTVVLAQYAIYPFENKGFIIWEQRDAPPLRRETVRECCKCLDLYAGPASASFLPHGAFLGR